MAVVVNVAESCRFCTKRSRTNLGERKRGLAPQNGTLTLVCGRCPTSLRIVNV